MAPPTESSVFRRNASASFTSFGDEGLIVVPHGAWQVVVNGTGLRVFELLDGRRTVGELASALADEYDVDPAEAVRDVVEILSELHAKGAVEPVLEDA